MTSIRAATMRLFEQLQPEGSEAIDAEFVTAPASLEDAAAVIAHAADSGLSVGIHGGGTHGGIGGRLRTDVSVVTSEMSSVIDYQPDDLTVVVGAGMPVADLEEVLAERGQTAILPERPGSGTVGGALAVGASAYRRLRYGATRERVLQVAMATGYGQVVQAGGRVVKSATGYDLARLCVGSLGSLGLIGSVCLKLWPLPIATATVEAEDAFAVQQVLYRPLAVLEADGRALVFLGGTAEEVESQMAVLGGSSKPGLHWPDPISSPVQVSLRVSPPDLEASVALLRSRGSAVTYRAQAGVGEVSAGFDDVEVEALLDARAWAESRGGSLVLVEGADDLYAALGGWGTPPASLAIQRRIKEAFDPAGVLNPGKLPGGL